MLPLLVNAQNGQYLGAGSGTTKLLLHLNGNSTDVSGNSNNGTDSNVTYSLANGKFNQGTSFNGTSSKITLGTSSTLNVYNSFTISIWFKTLDSSLYQIFFSKSVELICGIYEQKIFTQLVDNYTEAGNIINDSKWHLFTSTYNGTTCKVYLDGVLGQSKNMSSSSQTASAYIGFFPIPQLSFKGSIDEVIIENRAWTASEVRKYFTYSRGWLFGEIQDKTDLNNLKMFIPEKINYLSA